MTSESLEEVPPCALYLSNGRDLSLEQRLTAYSTARISDILGLYTFIGCWSR